MAISSNNKNLNKNFLSDKNEKSKKNMKIKIENIENSAKEYIISNNNNKIPNNINPSLHQFFKGSSISELGCNGNYKMNINSNYNLNFNKQGKSNLIVNGENEEKKVNNFKEDNLLKKQKSHLSINGHKRQNSEKILNSNENHVENNSKKKKDSKIPDGNFNNCEFNIDSLIENKNFNEENSISLKNSTFLEEYNV